MREWQKKTYWLVGASEGLGRAVAERLSASGTELVLSARDGDRLQELVEELPGRARAVTCDVTDAASVREAADSAGEIDGMVFLSGTYWPVRATEWDAERIEEMADVNFMGCLRVLGAVVPRMVQRNRGHIVLTGSLSGYRGLPGSIGYGSSKAGVMHLAESLRADLRDTAIDVQVVNPGYVRTRLTDRNDFDMPFMMEPAEAARVYFEHMNDDTFARSFPFFYGALFRLGRLLPDWAYYRLFR